MAGASENVWSFFVHLGAFFNNAKRQMRAGIHPARKMKAAMLIARCELDQDYVFN